MQGPHLARVECGADFRLFQQVGQLAVYVSLFTFFRQRLEQGAQPGGYGGCFVPFVIGGQRLDPAEADDALVFGIPNLFKTPSVNVIPGVQLHEQGVDGAV